ncbi:hypothetical protein HMPREF0970_01490 [Schaalia odontolytica F0309]|uniref:Uncharacterized protein n=1 Tax=Schaalia odontolytica F0309 TaxID=649742 RepID=D4TZV5_9ACTO|nr:hypothetical protein HMPREF0970_01490 [Schaalia odontolytica F0309]
MMPVCHDGAGAARGIRCADARADGVWLIDKEEGRGISMPAALRLGGFRVVAEQVWKGCHGDRHALDRREVRADCLVRMRIHARP